jgi:site-specific DNA-methyltransferase (adenine-specific)
MPNKNPKFKVVYRQLDQMKPLENNPRWIKKEDFERLCASVQNNPELFEAQPIILSNRTGENIIIAGNQRYRAAIEVGLKEVPTILLEGLTEAKEKEIIIRTNVTNGKWDFDILSSGLWGDVDELTDWGVEMSFMDGVDEDADSNDELRVDVEEDDFDEENEAIQSRVKQGEIWKLGNHRLMCGDSTSAEDVKKLCDGVSCDLWLTEPPYNVNYEGATKDKLKIANDNMQDEQFFNFLVASYQNANDNMKNGASFYIWHSDSEGANFRQAAKHIGWKVRECLIWNKSSMVLGRQDYQWKHEPCLYGWKDGASHNWYSDRKQTTVLDFNRPSVNSEHPTMKPVNLFAYLIQNSTKKGDVVLDSFGGSGTSIIACEQLERTCFTMEFDTHYCDVIISRWEKLTGHKAVKLD